MDIGVWWATVHGVAKSWTRLSRYTHRLKWGDEGNCSNTRTPEETASLGISLPLRHPAPRAKCLIERLGAFFAKSENAGRGLVAPSRQEAELTSLVIRLQRPRAGGAELLP